MWVHSDPLIQELFLWIDPDNKFLQEEKEKNTNKKRGVKG